MPQSAAQLAVRISQSETQKYYIKDGGILRDPDLSLSHMRADVIKYYLIKGCHSGYDLHFDPPRERELQLLLGNFLFTNRQIRTGYFYSSSRNFVSQCSVFTVPCERSAINLGRLSKMILEVRGCMV